LVLELLMAKQSVGYPRLPEFEASSGAESILSFSRQN
jgi:hypothetical protein